MRSPQQSFLPCTIKNIYFCSLLSVKRTFREDFFNLCTSRFVIISSCQKSWINSLIKPQMNFLYHYLTSIFSIMAMRQCWGFKTFSKFALIVDKIWPKHNDISSNKCLSNNFDTLDIIVMGLYFSALLLSSFLKMRMT